MNGSERNAWPEGTEAAQRLAAQVAAGEEVVPAFAKARVWSAIEARRKRAARRTVAFSLAGTAALACAALLVMRSAPSRSSLAGQSLLAEGAPRLLDVHGDARVVLGAGSRGAIVQDDASGIAFRIDRGSLLADVNHRPQGAPFRVLTPRATVIVVGTVLWVDVAADGDATVLVGRGAVQVSPASASSVLVKAGERWPAASVRAPAPSDLALLGDGARGTRFAPPFVGESPAVRDPCATLRGPEAIDCLERLAASSPDPLRAESALYQVGWRKLHDQGDAAGALAAWDRQRARFPEGALRAEADLSAVQALVVTGDRARARRALDSYLLSHPGDLAAPEAHFLRGKLEREAGDCERAVRDFDAALRSPAESWAGEARSERAACLDSRR